MPSPKQPVPVTPELLSGWPLPQPKPDKHERGIVLVVGGAGRTPGAALLAGTAALRVGAGQLRMAVADTAASAMAVAVPEALVAPLATEPSSGDICEASVSRALEHADGVDVVCLGPGLHGDRASRELTAALIRDLDPAVRVILDAMALRALGAALSASAQRSDPFVVTPNLGEAADLIGVGGHLQAEEAVPAARAISDRYGVIAMVHGAVAAPDADATWLDQTGPEGLATSGSGDVLAGIVAGLLARGADPVQAAVWATHLHTTAGRLCSNSIGSVGYLARDIADVLPKALSASVRA